MWTKMICVVVLVLTSVLTSVVAERSADTEPVLRLRLQDQTPAPTRVVRLRPRLNPGAMVQSPLVPMPRVKMQDSGRIGRFAYVSTPHPNVVVAVGSTADRSEIGRQIDRAIIDMSGAEPLYDHRQDRAPFIGVGVQAQVAQTGWSMDATVGTSFIDRAEPSRVFGTLNIEQSTALEAEARANFRLRYRF